MTMHSTTRRALLAAGAAALSARPARADPIDSASITPLGAMVAGKARPGPWRIGFANGYAGTPWRAMCVAAIQQEAAARPQQIAQLLVRDARASIGRQIADITELTRLRVDAILCIPNSPDALAAALAGATEQGIVTIPFNLPVQGEAWSSYVGTDPVQKGRALGSWLATALGGRGKIVGLGGLPGNPYSAAAWRGAEEAFKGTSVAPLTFTAAWWERARARAVMAGLIGAYPVIDGVWCDGGQDAAGAIEALMAARRRLVPVTGDDNNGLLKLYAALAGRDPGFSFGLISEPTWQGVIALRAALTLLSGGSVPKRQIVMPALITQANYQRYIRPRLPDQVFVDTTLDDATLARIFA
jgi:ribose transport system substrate-binding protein